MDDPQNSFPVLIIAAPHKLQKQLQSFLKILCKSIPEHAHHRMTVLTGFFFRIQFIKGAVVKQLLFLVFLLFYSKTAGIQFC